MNDDFTYDVFISHSAADGPTAVRIAQRLRDDGLAVWPSASFVDNSDRPKIEDILARSRVLVLFMSAAAFGDDWSALETNTFHFRDPQNSSKRFVPVRLDDTPIKDSIAHFAYLDWRSADVAAHYAQLVDVCRPPARVAAALTGQSQEFIIDTVRLDVDNRSLTAFAASSDGKWALVGTNDGYLSLWDLNTGRRVRLLRSHRRLVSYLRWSDDQRFALVASGDDDVKLVDVESDRIVADYNKAAITKRQMDCARLLAGGRSGAGIERSLRLHNMTVGSHLRRLKATFGVQKLKELRNLLRMLYGGTADSKAPALTAADDWIPYVAWHVEMILALRGFGSETTKPRLRLCTHFGSRWQRHFDELYANPWCSALTEDRALIVTGHGDGVVRLSDVREGRPVRILEGHTTKVTSVTVHPDQQHVLSCAADGVRIWNIASGRMTCALLQHRANPIGAVWTLDGRYLISIDRSGTAIKWSAVGLLAGQPGKASAASSEAATDCSDQVQYTNAKVLLVGDSGVGKTGLANYLAHGLTVADDRPIPSTDGAWATHWPLDRTMTTSGTQREIWLWDFAGQVDYRLVHQVFMNDTAVAVLVFNPQDERPFDGLGRWDRDIDLAVRKPFVKLLVAGRVDRGSLLVREASVGQFMNERGYAPPLHTTSAKTGEGCQGLKDAIVSSIRWEQIPTTTSPRLYLRMKKEILNLREGGTTLLRAAELKQRMEMSLTGDTVAMTELDSVVTLLTGIGMIQRLGFGGFILLRPEVLSRYAAAVVRKVRKHPQEMGCIEEDELLSGRLDYQDFERLPQDDEDVVLRALLDMFVSRAWCIRQSIETTALLTFPSYFRRERKEQPTHPHVLVTYRFDGAAESIYATLVVRLHHTLAFETVNLWNAAADFRTQTGAALGFTLTSEGEGTSRLEVYFAQEVDLNSRVLFLRYVHEHLEEHAAKVIRLRHYCCTNRRCDAYGESFVDRSRIDKALKLGAARKVFCPACGKPIRLHDEIEEKFTSSHVVERVFQLQTDAQEEIDNESRELLAVHHTGYIVAEAGQIYRGYTNSDHGIDAEIEFKDDGGAATGRRLYLQLKSGDSYLKRRRSDGVEVFRIKKRRWVEYWTRQAYAVMLVIRCADGSIRWMDVSAYLRKAAERGVGVRQILFEGEPLDVMSVRQWRHRLLAQ